MRRLVAIVVCCSLGFTPMAAQQAPSRPVIPALGETVEVSIINVDVIVTDASGRRVRGLTKNDFEIFEDGKLQPVSNFAEYASAGEGRVTAEGTLRQPEAAPRQRRNVVIFLEEFRLQEFRIQPFFASLQNLVRKTVEEGDSLTLITYENHRPVVRIESSGDVEEITRALDELQPRFIGVMEPSAAIAYRQARERREFETSASAAAQGKGLSRVPTDPEQLAILEARIFAMQARDEMRRRIDAINGVIHRLAGADGRKILLLATQRLGAYSGAEFFYAAGLDRVPMSEHDEFDNRDEVRTIIDNANEAGVTIYPVFPSGLDTEALGTEVHLRSGAEVVAQAGADPDNPRSLDGLILVNENSMLTEVAAKTGGVTSWGTANIANLLPRVADDLTDYYSLAYRATPKRDGVPRQVVVRTKNRSYEVRARREVVEKSDDIRMKDRVAAALFGTVAEPAFAIEAQAQPAKKNGRSDLLPVAVRVPLSALTLVPGQARFTGAFSVYVAAGNDRGDVSEVNRETQTFEIPEADLARTDNAHFTYELQMKIARSTTRVAVGVLDEVSKSYSVTSLPVVR